MTIEVRLHVKVTLYIIFSGLTSLFPAADNFGLARA